MGALMNPFEAFGRAMQDLADDRPRERLSDEERAAIKARAEKRRIEEVQEEYKEMADTVPLMMDAFEKAGVHKRMATFMFNFFKELKAAGFSDQQALTIAAQNFNVMGDQ